MKKTALAVVVLAAIGVAGCGSDSDDDDTTTGTDTGTTSGETTGGTTSGETTGGTTGGETTGGTTGGTGDTTSVLPLSIDSDLTLDASIIYEIPGQVTVNPPATLTIPAGTRLYASAENAYIAVTQGADIVAVGTADAPILMTSEQDFLSGFTQEVDSLDSQGQWGGLTLLGVAETNEGLDEYEADALPFGCDDVAVACDNSDSSGRLEYVVLKHTGFEVEVDAELNGLSLAGVGNGTVINNVAVLAGSDDGIEVWGGTVNMTNIYMYNASDDSLDWDQGWTGSANNVFIEQSTVAGSGSRGMETDNNGGLEDETGKTPISNPTITNFTVRTVDGGGQGIVNREGTAGNLTNGLIVVGDTGRPCVQIRSRSTFESGLMYTDIACVQGAGLYYQGADEDTAADDPIFGNVSDAEAASLVGGGASVNVSSEADLFQTYGADNGAFTWLDQFRNP